MKRYFQTAACRVSNVSTTPAVVCSGGEQSENTFVLHLLKYAVAAWNVIVTRTLRRRARRSYYMFLRSFMFE